MQHIDHRTAGPRRGLRGLALAGLFVTVLPAIPACRGQSDPEAGETARPVAIVGDDTVTVGETAEYMQAARIDRTREGLERAVDDLVAVEIVKTAARQEQLTPEQERLRSGWERQLRMYQFRDSVIYKTATVPDSAVEAFYKENVGEEIKARHILVGVPVDAAPEQKSEARARAEEALAKARAGEDFAALSRQYSEPRTAATGGELDWFAKGDMVPGFEQAAFALEPGEISSLVETRFGFHVIKVEDRRKKTLEEVRPDIERALGAPLRQQAEDRYLQQMMAQSGLDFHDANIDTLVAIFAQDSVGELPPERRDLPIATWNEGTYTVEDVLELYAALPPENRSAVKALDRQRMLDALAPVVRNEMLMARAERSGIELDTERRRNLDERVEALVATEMLRQQVKEQATISDSAVEAEYRANPSLYGSSLQAARDSVRAGLLAREMARANSPEGQRELVRELGRKHASKVDVEKIEKNYELVLEQLAPADSAAEVAARAAMAAQARAQSQAQPEGAGEAGVAGGVAGAAPPAAGGTAGAAPPAAGGTTPGDTASPPEAPGGDEEGG